MALKNKWVDRVDNQDIVFANDINSVAHAVIDLEDKIDDNVYKLPVASKTTLGGVKIGNGLSISQDGTLSADNTGTGGEGINWRGQYYTTAYAVNDAVYYEGSSYICIKTHDILNIHYPTETEYWDIMAQKGDKGEDGASANLVVDVKYASGTYTSTTTWAELSAAVEANEYVVLRFTDMLFPISCVSPSGTNITFQALFDSQIIKFEATKGDAGSISFTLTQTKIISDGGGMNWRSAYSEENDYAVNDVVKYGGSLYIAMQASTAASPHKPTETAYWMLMVAGGGASIETVDENNVVFSKDYYTAYDIGKVKGSTERQLLIGEGKSLADFMSLFDEERNPTIVQPSVSLTFAQARAYEVGTQVTPTYRASFNAGSYEYDTTTSVLVTAWEVRDSAGNSLSEATGTFPLIQVADDTAYLIRAKATHTAGTIPHTNQGNEYAAGQIEAGSKAATSGAATGYRNTFYGTKTTKDVLDSDEIRALSKSSKALANGSTFSISIPVGALRIVIAYPATLRDLTSVIDVNGMNTNIVGSFVKSAIDVEGANGFNAISYKVYVLDYAEGASVANTYKVTI